MASTNVKERIEYGVTHEGAQAAPARGAFAIAPVDQLLRQVSTCLLWEDTHYESGDEIAEGIRKSAASCSLAEIAAVAIKARTDLKLRHVPLFLVVQMLRKEKVVGEVRTIIADTITQVVRRPDEMGELISLYWKEIGRNEKTVAPAQKSLASAKLPWQLRQGLARIFPTFSAHALAKWNESDKAVKLKDVLFLVHARPRDDAQKATWKALIDGTLPAADTWEVGLSSGADKKETWERLLTEGKLGDMATLMNLRNMAKAGVDSKMVKERLRNWSPNSVALPFRFIAAAQAAPDLEDDLGTAMAAALKTTTLLAGRTLYVVDVSGSMQSPLGGRSKLDRVDAACGLAMLLREVCEDVAIYATAGSDAMRVHATVKLAPRRLFALRDAIKTSMTKLGGGGIFAFQALSFISEQERDSFARVIVLTDEQDCDYDRKRTLAKSPRLAPYQYVLNVSPYAPGLVTAGGWERINGWSERVIDWIAFNESRTEAQAVGDEA